MPPGCGKALLLPRQLSLDGAELLIEPVAEVEHLRRSEGRTAAVLPAVPASNPGIALASGSQVEVRLNCSGLEGIGNGTIAVRTLATADGGAFTEIGYDLSRQAFYVDHTRCCSQPNAAVQRAPLPLSRLGGALSMVVLVDGGVVEAFSTGLAITALVSPGEGTPPSARVTTVLKSATEATCDVQSWQLAL
jgi:sucrose-6-phosphate hydrolase SacC (GH32 family)